MRPIYSPSDGQNDVVEQDRGAYNIKTLCTMFEVRPLIRAKVWGRGKSCAPSSPRLCRRRDNFPTGGGQAVGPATMLWSCFGEARKVRSHRRN